MKPVLPSLDFADAEQTEQTVRTYIDLFRAVFGHAGELARTTFSQAQIDTVQRLHGSSSEQLPGPAGAVKTIRFHLNGMELLALNGGGYFGRFHESFSLYVNCDTQAQIDRLHEALSEGGQVQPCGWVKDRFGVSQADRSGVRSDRRRGPRPWRRRAHERGDSRDDKDRPGSTSEVITMNVHCIFGMPFAKVYPMYVQKAERKGRTKNEVDRIITWLAGYDTAAVARQLARGVDFSTFFAAAPALNPHASRITGVVCGVRVETIEGLLMRKIRWLDKLIDELAKGRPMEKILRSG